VCVRRDQTVLAPPLRRPCQSARRLNGMRVMQEFSLSEVTEHSHGAEELLVFFS